MVPCCNDQSASVMQSLCLWHCDSARGAAQQRAMLVMALRGLHRDARCAPGDAKHATWRWGVMQVWSEAHRSRSHSLPRPSRPRGLGGSLACLRASAWKRSKSASARGAGMLKKRARTSRGPLGSVTPGGNSRLGAPGMNGGGAVACKAGLTQGGGAEDWRWGHASSKHTESYQHPPHASDPLIASLPLSLSLHRCLAVVTG